MFKQYIIIMYNNKGIGKLLLNLLSNLTANISIDYVFIPTIVISHVKIQHQIICVLLIQDWRTQIVHPWCDRGYL